MYDAKEDHYRPFDLHKLTDDHLGRVKQGDLRVAVWIGSEDIVKGANVQYNALRKEQGGNHSHNDWEERPELRGVGHQLPRYFELYGTEILQFHTEAFEK